MANFLKKLRTDSGVRQVDLAKTLKVSQATLSNWERGEYDIDNETLKELSDIFGVSIDYILTGETQQKTPPAKAGSEELDEIIAYLDQLPAEALPRALNILRAAMPVDNDKT